ncbi:uncharacterized protein TNCV_3655581 [Trichonephila clavipes]|nr:uncharacterized protein TNCV_3655581 [Trichonephila clavipes]
MSFTRRPGSGFPRQTSCRDRHIVRNACVQPTASSATIQAQGPMSLLEPYDGSWLEDIWDRGAHYMFCPYRPPIDASVWSGTTHEEARLQWNGTRSSLATNLDSIPAVMTIMFECGDPVLNALILHFLYSDTPLR